MVAMNVWPTDASDGSVATEARWRKMARMWTPDGVADGIGGEMAPSLAGLNLTVQAGAAWVDGHYTELTGSQVLTVTANGIVVVRFDPSANTAQLLYRDAATTPVQTPGGIWEILIASMSGSAMTDRRTAASSKSGALLAQKFTTGNITIGGSATDLPGLTVTVTTKPGRRYLVYGKANYQSSTGAPTVETRIYEDGAVTIVDSVQNTAVNVSQSFQALVSCFRTPAAGTHTWKMTANTAGAVQLIQNLTPQCYIAVEDKGPAI